MTAPDPRADSTEEGDETTFWRRTPWAMVAVRFVMSISFNIETARAGISWAFVLTAAMPTASLIAVWLVMPNERVGRG